VFGRLALILQIMSDAEIHHFCKESDYDVGRTS
jgi:hypothetical protein